ncbi:DUF1963 domain-containing protein [Pseudomonas ovata]|uniref:DUF1963 domain-containing protein n=1 Tax=Pseudomonas ovata TaxID=1839709 RepID=UPI000D68ECBF|nr:DUF1963 domain-containing protein [Pseudomonas ovata]
MNQQVRWLTRDFVFAAPAAFPNVIALEPERFRLGPATHTEVSPGLFVLALDAPGGLDLDGAFAALAADLLGLNSEVDWLVEPKQLFGREARRGMAEVATAGATETVEVLLVRGPDERAWGFGRRSREIDERIAAQGFTTLLDSLQALASSTSARLLQSQFHTQQRKRLQIAEAQTHPERNLPDPTNPVWKNRFAAAMAVDEEAGVEPMMTAAVALVEEPYGDPAPLGASRIGGGPDLPPGAWPTNAYGMRHPFLMQIDLAEVTSACGPMAPLPQAGLLSFFVHDDALLVDVVYSPPGARLVRFPMTQALIEASQAAIRLIDDLADNTKPGPLPHDEGDHVAATLRDDGTFGFSHSPDPVWAYGTPGEAFDALSDERWACVASARLRPVLTQSINVAEAQSRIEDLGVGSGSALEDISEDLRRAPLGTRSNARLAPVHQMLGYATYAGGQDCRQEVAGSAQQDEHADLTDPESWMVLVHINADSTTGRVFWDALDLTVMAPRSDVAAGRWERCVLLPG